MPRGLGGVMEGVDSGSGRGGRGRGLISIIKFTPQSIASNEKVFVFQLNIDFRLSIWVNYLCSILL